MATHTSCSHQGAVKIFDFWFNCSKRNQSTHRGHRAHSGGLNTVLGSYSRGRYPPGHIIRGGVNISGTARPRRSHICAAKLPLLEVNVKLPTGGCVGGEVERRESSPLPFLFLWFFLFRYLPFLLSCRRHSHLHTFSLEPGRTCVPDIAGPFPLYSRYLECLSSNCR